MKKAIISFVIVLTTVFGFAAVASAAPGKTSTPYDGVFEGTVYGDQRTTAPISLDLTQEGDVVEGSVVLGDGLFVDAGFCGGAYIPASTQFATGVVDSRDPNHLAASTVIEVSGFEVTVHLDSNVAADGDSIDANVKIDLPWICGGDVEIDSALERI